MHIPKLCFKQLLLAYTLNVICLVGTLVLCGKEMTQVLKKVLEKSGDLALTEDGALTTGARGENYDGCQWALT